jgi:hypothetical protein
LTSEVRAIEISDVPGLRHIAEEVRSSGKPTVLRQNGEDIAILKPVRRRARRTPSKADIEAFLSSAGSWKDADTDTFITEVYESRKRSSRPPVEL